MGSGHRGDVSRRRGPIAARALLRAASWIVPRGVRPAWRAKWNDGLDALEVLADRGAVTNRGSARTVRYIGGALQDAFWTRFSREAVRRIRRGPAMPLACACLALLGLAGATHFFERTRSLFRPLPIRDPGSLAAIRYSGAVNEPSGVPPRLLPLWRAKARTLAGIAGYTREAGSPRARVTSNFFSLLGVRAALGLTLEAGGWDAAVLSNSAWRSVFGADPFVIGRTIDVEGSQVRVIGVLPDTFWAISRTIDVWTPLDLESDPPPQTPFLIGAVARIGPGQREDQVRADLFDTAKSAGYFLPRPPEVASFQAIPSRPLLLCFVALGFALFSGGAVVATGARLPRGGGWRFRGYLVLKVATLAAFCWLLWVEVEMALFSGLATGMLRSFLAGIVAAPAFVAGCAFAIWWSFADQRRRCPACLQLLSMPVTMGSWGSVLDPATTESLCDSGHGALCQPESAEGLPDKWTKLDPSWSELFGDKRE